MNRWREIARTAGALVAVLAALVLTPGAGATVTQIAQLTPSDTDAGLESVTVAGGYVFAAAPLTSGTDGTTQGAILVFAQPSGGWSGGLHEVAEMTPAPGARVTGLGRSLAISPDGSTVFAGAESSSEDAVYAFTEPAGGWAGTLHESARLVGRHSPPGSTLGSSLALQGDTLVAGDPNVSAADVFTRPAGGWTGTVTATAQLTSTDPAVYEGAATNFGWTVAIAGQTIVIGEDPAAFGWPGVAYVFTEPAGGWADATQTARLVASAGNQMHEFPSPARQLVSVSSSGDTVAVQGALPGQPISVPSVVFVYARPAGGWSGTQNESATLSASTGAGIASPLIGAGTIFAAGGGDVFAFDEAAGGWSGSQHESGTLTASDGGNLPDALSLDGTTLVSGGSLAGSTAAAFSDTYLFDPPPGGWSGTIHETAKLRTGQPSQPGVPQSQASVFAKPAGGWTSASASATLSPSGGVGALWFTSVAAQGPTVVATPNVNTAIDEIAPSGPAYVFTKSTGGWSDAAQSAILSAADGTPLGPADVWGATVAAAGGGRVYVFSRPGPGWDGPQHETAVLSDPHQSLSAPRVSGLTVAAGSDLFVEPVGGWQGSTTPRARLTTPTGSASVHAVAIDGGTVIAEPDTPGRVPHEVYLYTRPALGWSGTVKPTATLTGTSRFEFTYSIAVSGRVVSALGGDAVNAPGLATFVEPARGWRGTQGPNSVIPRGFFLGNSPFSAQVASYHGTVATLTTTYDYKNGEFSGGLIDVFGAPANGWAHGRETATSDQATTGDGASLALEPHTLFVSGSSVTVSSLSGAGPPAAVAPRLTGLSASHPRLSMHLYHGTDAPSLRSVTITLPKGLRFTSVRRRLAAGVTLGRALKGALTLTHDRLTVDLRFPNSPLTMTIARRALVESRALRRRLTPPRGKRRHPRPRTIRMKLGVRMLDDAGTANTAHLTVTGR